MIDLGVRSKVNGVVVITWQGAGQDKITSYTDYVYNLDSLMVHVSNTPQLNYTQVASQPQCSTITRKNTALFNPKLHFDCPSPMKGRYVYLKANGVPNRWKKLFSLVLCEVMVY